MSLDQAAGVFQSAGSWAAAAIALAGSVALLRRRMSRDETARTADRTESEFIKRLLIDRDLAIAEEREATRARQRDSQAIARLTAENAHQEREIARLKTEFAAFKRLILRLHPDLQPFLESGHPPLEKTTL